MTPCGTFLIAVWMLLPIQEQPPGADPAPQTPTTAPTRAPTTQPAQPAQAEMFRELIRNVERPRAVTPIAPLGESPRREALIRKDLIADGTIIADRAGEVLRQSDRSVFVFEPTGSTVSSRPLELLRNQWLEALEREVELGLTHFIVTAEVTRYRDQNYLILLKYRRPPSHGNLTP